MTEELKKYEGGCHCGAVRFAVESAPITSALECNCSHCQIKGMLLMFVPGTAFTQTAGKEKLTEYRFNQKKIAHQFCAVCGVQPFAFGEDKDGNPTACINVRCIDDLDIEALERNKFNGKDF